MSKLEELRKLIISERDKLNKLEIEEKRMEELEKFKQNDIEITKINKPEDIVRSENPKLPEQEIKYEKKLIYPKKTVIGKDYYKEKRDDILKQKKEYYKNNKEKRIEYQSQWYQRKKEEEYKAKNNGSLEGFVAPKKYNKV